MQYELKRIHRATGTTFLFVTHDQNEAMALADRIAVFDKGQLQQVGAPIEIYTSPKTEFVANFIGESTLLSGNLTAGNFNGDGLNISGISSTVAIDGQVKLFIRPEAFSINTGSIKCGSVMLKEIIFAGDTLEVLLASNTGLAIKVKAEVAQLPQMRIGELVDLYVDPSQIGQLS